MTTETEELRSLSRDIDYLSDLGGKLKNPQNFAKLAAEHDQTADDAAGAKCMAFGVKVPVGTAGQPLTAEDVINNILGPDGGTSPCRPRERQKTSQSRPDGAGKGTGTGRGQPSDGRRHFGSVTRGRSEGRRPSRGSYSMQNGYVSCTDSCENRQTNTLQAECLENVNLTVMQDVLAYEVSQQRKPREMPLLTTG